MTENGFDKSLINQIITTNKKDYTEIFNQKQDSINLVFRNAASLVKEQNIKFDPSNGSITKQADYSSKKIVIGSIKLNGNKYYLKENTLDIGIWDNDKLTLENGKTFFIKGSLTSSVNPKVDEKFANNLIGLALLEGYGLENQLYYKKEEDRKNGIIQNSIDLQDKIADAKANSLNLYDVPGYLIDEKGNKMTEKLYINFEDATSKVEKRNVESMENYGKSVYLKAANEKGKEKSTRYKSNTGAKFCTDSGDCYLGLKTTGNTFNALGNVMSLSTDFSYFYKIMSEDNGYLILKEPASNKLYVKIPHQEKALYLGNTNDDKLQKNFNEYVKCDLNSSDFDLKSIDGIKVFIEKHKITCK